MERTDTGYVQFLNLQNSLNQLRTQSMDWHLVALLLKLAEAIASGGGFSFPSIFVTIYLSLSVLCKRMKLEQEKRLSQSSPEKHWGVSYEKSIVLTLYSTYPRHKLELLSSSYHFHIPSGIRQTPRSPFPP